MTTFVTMTGGVDTYWRADLPARQLGAKWIRVPADDAQRAFGEPNRDTPFPWYPWIEGRWFFPSNEVIWKTFSQVLEDIRYPEVEGDTVVFTRPDSIRAKHAIALNEQGVTTVAELDDSLVSDPYLNIFMRMNELNHHDRRVHLKAFSVFDKVVFSTEWLLDEYRKAYKMLLGKEMRELGMELPEFHVCHNHVDMDDWPERIESDGPLRVGWMGSAQHYRDVKLAYGAFHLAQGAGCQIYMVGADFSNLSGVNNPRARESVLRWKMLNAKTIPWVEPEEYHRTALPFDIGVIPLERNKHTMGKSDVKALEYTISGSAVIAQSHPVYTKFWKHNETCLLANSPEEFARSMKELIEHPRLRERLVEAAQQYVREERTMQVQGKHEWRAAVGDHTPSYALES